MPDAVSSSTDIVLYFMAILLPPLPVFMKRGCEIDLWINIILCIFAWIPGIIHAWWVIARTPGVRM
ncbi:hypothetical protein K443DRAFT_681292 [Laccaria amethystina LaAM-08-1]|uniref:Uncharacterized protein n=1 Tax=Laccaria amethystina LaAM-08-1 TaxID=1095629 RepID=A0A0C9XNY3_9AGAR|nr:hypothetical protein K443DRAFT_681292 [Laccaria amethystina LaAM-08-1]